MSERFHFGLLGHKIAYSQSPDIFAAIAKHTGHKITFDLFDIAPLDLAFFMQRVHSHELSGMAVTIPHKEAILPFLTECDQTAADLGAVNSIRIGPENLSGFNTDWQGVAQSLTGYDKQINNGRVLILGTGGIARAVVYAVCQSYKPREVSVVGRSHEHLANLQQTCSRFDLTCHAIEREAFDAGKDKFHLVVNCTPLGGWHYPNVTPLPDGLEWRQIGVYFDVNYNSDNMYVDAARKSKIPALDGRLLLVAQAVKSFELWTGETVELEKVYRTVYKAKPIAKR
ncbi:MAG: shikimate dehydrogenase [bacterium]|nr:shikimate dehydrogenase [bacterium]